MCSIPSRVQLAGMARLFVSTSAPSVAAMSNQD
jgi:hypothetical protein